MQGNESFYPNDWFAKGDSDLNAVETLLEVQNLDVAAFHIQQAIEKYLKGYIILKGGKLRRVHELDDLLDEAISYNSTFEKFRPLCEIATEYYIEERYPFLVSSELNKEELEKQVEDTKKLIDFIKKEKREGI